MYSKILLFYVLYIVHLTTLLTESKTESKLVSVRNDPFHLRTEDYDLICRLQPNGYHCDEQNTNPKTPCGCTQSLTDSIARPRAQDVHEDFTEKKYIKIRIAALPSPERERSCRWSGHLKEQLMIRAVSRITDCLPPKIRSDQALHPDRPNFRRKFYYTTFYYNTIMKTCMTFEYGDCDYGLNQFDKLNECNEVCMGGLIQDSKVLQNLTTDVICRLQPDAGTCNEYIPMYYYDISTRSCKGFAYKGCEGNSNRFLNELECRAICNEAVPMPQKVVYE